GRNGKSQSIIVGPWGDRVTN
uniref:Agglutinin beta-2 chain n=1 Tax=Maclura pomifera TaxID=3496 RepID=LECB2_MACPO|nr:RecName: Full=Agglutinin beta-2 chain; AltName: Full=MPA [Maclura pomifera]1JOT_B Chain B, AGGLUTININ [Maclura pomifera]